MCDATAIAVTSLVVGTVGSISAYAQQNYAADAANTNALNQLKLQNQSQLAQQQQALDTALFNMSTQNSAISLSNQRMLNDWVMTAKQTSNANLTLQREWYQATQQKFYTDMTGQLEFQASLNKSILSEMRAESQQQLNQMDLNAGLEAAQEKRNNAQALRSFEAERLMASSLQAQGSILSQGRSGQSIGLALQNETAKYGRDMRMGQRNSTNISSDFYSEVTNAYLTKAQEDAKAIASISPRPFEPMTLPDIAPPVFADLPNDPIFTPFMDNPGPVGSPVFQSTAAFTPGGSELGLVAGIGSAAIGSLGTYYQMDNLINKPKEKPKPKPKSNPKK